MKFKSYEDVKVIEEYLYTVDKVNLKDKELLEEHINVLLFIFMEDYFRDVARVRDIEEPEYKFVIRKDITTMTRTLENFIIYSLPALVDDEISKIHQEIQPGNGYEWCFSNKWKVLETEVLEETSTLQFEMIVKVKRR